jgi:hypothetical protein
MGPAMEAAEMSGQAALVDGRAVLISALCVLLAAAAALVAQGLVRLIALVTNLSFYGRLSFRPVDPWQHHLGVWVVFVPIVGAVIVGVMARYGSKAIRGHGIPEAMEQVLTNRSRIPARMTFLKPLSAAIAIGTGGPFGEGKRMPISETRAMLRAALSGELDDAELRVDENFGFGVPKAIPGVDEKLLDPRSTWDDPAAYDNQARELAEMFRKNFEKFAEAGEEVVSAGPKP